MKRNGKMSVFTSNFNNRSAEDAKKKKDISNKRRVQTDSIAQSMS